MPINVKSHWGDWAGYSLIWWSTIQVHARAIELFSLPLFLHRGNAVFWEGPSCCRCSECGGGLCLSWSRPFRVLVEELLVRPDILTEGRQIQGLLIAYSCILQVNASGKWLLLS
jgi:hypothetical protein